MNGAPGSPEQTPSALLTATGAAVTAGRVEHDIDCWRNFVPSRPAVGTSKACLWHTEAVPAVWQGAEWLARCSELPTVWVDLFEVTSIAGAAIRVDTALAAAGPSADSCYAVLRAEGDAPGDAQQQR